MFIESLCEFSIKTGAKKVNSRSLSACVPLITDAPNKKVKKKNEQNQYRTVTVFHSEPILNLRRS